MRRDETWRRVLFVAALVMAMLPQTGRAQENKPNVLFIKSKLWEEAIRVPLIVSAPGKKQGVKCEHTVELVDLYPTLTELAGLPKEPGVQGQSLTPLLDDLRSSLPRKDALTQVSAGFGLRSGKWAYMWYPASRKHKSEGFMLYDMEQDPSQYTNLASNPEHALIKRQLHQRLMERIEAARN